MLSGQLAMIFSPLAMSSLSYTSQSLPWFVSACSGVIVVTCMLLILRTPGGVKAGRVSSDDMQQV